MVAFHCQVCAGVNVRISLADVTDKNGLHATCENELEGNSRKQHETTKNVKMKRGRFRVMPHGFRMQTSMHTLHHGRRVPINTVYMYIGSTGEDTGIPPAGNPPSSIWMV